MPRHNRYLDVCRRLINRYRRKDGSVVLSVGERPTRYAYLEAMAAVKYLGCDPRLMGIPGLTTLRIRVIK